MSVLGSISVERLRVWLLVGAGLLVAVIAAFLGYAHYRAHRLIKDLPHKLGIDIQQETTGFTYSQSAGPTGRTIYTIHASKAVQRTNGKVNLHDVGIVLYGQGSSNRVDRIYGNEFEYDQNAGVIRAVGEVHIDLQAPAPTDAKTKAEYAKGGEVHPAGGEDAHLVHVTTSGLVFLQKLGVAATDEDLEFEFNGMNGHAHGAEYNSDTGLLVLQSAVKVNGMKGDEPVVLTSDHAEMDRKNNQVSLTRAVYTLLGGKAGARVARAERVTAYLRQDGSVDRAVGEGGVSLTDENGATLAATRGEVHLDGKNQPQTGALSGGVRYRADEPLRQARGEAEEGKADFGRAGILQHVALTGAVHLHERTRTSDLSQAWSERDLVSKVLDLTMTAGSGQQILLRQAQATGDARLSVVNPPAVDAGSGHNGATTSVLSGDLLTADFVTRGGASHVKTVHGRGHTALRRVSDAGAIGTSSGETLEAEFRGVEREKAGSQRLAKGATAAKESGDEIATAVQQGHVVMTNMPVAKGGVATGATAGDVTQRASADRAVYDEDKENVTLTGAVQMSDADATVWADQVVMQQQTGDALAEGAVRASYLQPKDASGKDANGKGGDAAEPVHVLAARGEFKHEAGEAKFYGVAGKPARLWEGGSQVEAPVLQFEQTERRLIARGDGRAAGMVVHAVFVNSAAAGVGSAKPTSGGGNGVPVRVASHEMTYDDVARRGDFTGGVLVEDVDGSMRSERAVVYLKAADGGKSAASASAPGAFMGGSVERMVASGQVEVMQPGRRATGEQLLYTAADGMFVMTGQRGVLPKIMDEAQGAITGASLRFHAGDNRVVVSNGPEGGLKQRVRTETRVKQ